MAAVKKGIFICFIAVLSVFLLIMPVASDVPIADFSGTPTTVAPSLPVLFKDQSTGNPTGWAWFFGDETYTQPWTQMTSSADWTGRFSFSSVAMLDGSIVVMGGGTAMGGRGMNDVWRSTNSGTTWTPITKSAVWSARYGQSSVAMPDGSIILMGGYDVSNSHKNDVWRSTDNGATWTQMTANAGWSPRFSQSSVVMPDGSIVLIGGQNNAGFLNDVWRSTNNGATWTQMTANAGWSPRSVFSCVSMPDGSIVLMGGTTSSGGTWLNDVWRSMNNGVTWTQMTANAGWSPRAFHSSVSMPDGSILLMGGRVSNTNDKNDFWRSTDNGASWSQVTSSAGWPARDYHTSVAMSDGSIVLMGGYDITNKNGKNDVWRIMPIGSSEKNPSHIYTTQGTYPVALQAYKASGYGSSRKPGYITVKTAPIVIPEVTSDTNVGTAPKVTDSPVVPSQPKQSSSPSLPPTTVSTTSPPPPSYGDFTISLPIIIVLIILLIAMGGYAAYRMKKKPSDDLPPTHSSKISDEPRPVSSKQLPPDLADKYTESEFIGKGGFARVFKAKRKDGKYVAVKIPITMDATTGKSFIAEMQNWTNLSHPNIVKLYDFNIMPMPYFEEELCDSALADRNKPIEIDEAAWIVFNICEGLKFAHAKKIIHRDLKPQNILLKNGVPKISDWGLSRILSESISTTTTTSFTWYYAAPEQINSTLKDERTDIWQLGVILYELITGILPFKGDSLMEIGMNIATKDPVPPGEIMPDVKAFDAIVMKCLQKTPGNRYQTVLELQKDLAAFMGMDFAMSLTKSMREEDSVRSAYLCGELLQMSMKTSDIKSSMKYASTLVNYTRGENKKAVLELVDQLKIRIDRGIDEIPDELIQKADLIVHQVSMEFGKKR